MAKIFDCITFFRENFITNLRFEILNEAVDYFVVCESRYDHRGRRKELNFNLKNFKFKDKLIYLVLEQPFSRLNNLWENQAKQREYLFNGLKEASPEDLIMFSDPDEIPRPELLKNFSLNQNYAIFLQKCFCYKLNIFNKHETPWQGTRVCKMKNLKSFDYMRQKIVQKNLSKPFWKFYINKSIQLIENGGWHFNSLLTAEEISIKLKTFAHSEFALEEYSDINIIKKNILAMKDLFNRNKFYHKVELDDSYPEFILKNRNLFASWIL